MGKRVRRIFTEDFRREAVRLTEKSSRMIMQVADYLRIGLFSLTRWNRQYRATDLLQFLTSPRSNIMPAFCASTMKSSHLYLC